MLLRCVRKRANCSSIIFVILWRSSRGPLGERGLAPQKMGRAARSVKSLIFGFLLPVANENGNVRVLFYHPRDGMAELCGNDPHRPSRDASSGLRQDEGGHSGDAMRDPPGAGPGCGQPGGPALNSWGAGTRVG